MWLRAVTNDKFFEFEPTCPFGYFRRPSGWGEKTPMDKTDGFPRAVRYALALAFAFALSLMTVFAFGGLPLP